MIGYYLESEALDYSLEAIFEGQSNNNWCYWLNEMIDTLKSTLNFKPEDNEIYLVAAEYFGTPEDNEWNDVLHETEITSINQFIEYWNPKTQALIDSHS